MKVLITGRSGVGKSTTIRAPSERGNTVFDTDDIPGVSRLEDKTTGEPVEWPEGFVDWDHYAWRWQKAGLEHLLDVPDDVIVGAVMSNQADFYHLFDVIIVLTISAETLRQRLKNRTDHTYGNDNRNIERSVEKHVRKQAELLQAGMIEVDNSRTTNEVVDQIISILNDNKFSNDGQ